MQLCFGCLHSFHSTAFEEGRCNFNEEVITRFEGIRATATKFQPTTPFARQHVAELEGEIKLLAKAMKLTVDEKNSEIAQLTAQVHFLGEQLEELVKLRQDVLLQSSAIAASSSPRGRPGPTPSGGHSSAGPNGNSTNVASGLLNRFLLASQKQPVSPRGSYSGRGGSVIEDRFGNTISATPVGNQFSRPSTQGGSRGPMGSSFVTQGAASKASQIAASYRSQVSASIYSVLEAVVVKARADYGAVWICAAESDGLVATFTAGRGAKGGDGGAKATSSPSKKRAVPYYIALNSIPGSVASTGVILNMTAEVPPKPADFVPATDHDLLTNVCTQHSSLSVPVFSRYGAATRKVMAVLQLFGGSPMGTPFTVDDERLAETSSVLLSHIISTHYGSLVGDWMTSAFDPTPMTNQSHYYSDLDQSPRHKGADGFASPPMLVYRGRYSGTLDDQQQQHQAGQAGKTGAKGSHHSSAFLTSVPPPVKMRNLRCDMSEFGTPVEAYTGLRDITKYLDELEGIKRNGGVGGGADFVFGISISIPAPPPAPSVVIFTEALQSPISTPSKSSLVPIGTGGGGGASETAAALPSLMKPRPPMGARFNPTNQTTSGSTTPGGGGQRFLKPMTTINAAAIETLEVDTISRLDTLMAEMRGKR